MVKSITVKLDAVEMMIYFWQAVSEREKVSEMYMREVADKHEMKYLYDEEFNQESVRKVLSAISNRELLSGATKAERKFWNNNMWMMEDLENMRNMIKPIKTLNLDDLKDSISGEDKDLEVVFIPGHQSEYTIDENKLVINFFRIMVDYMDPNKVTISQKPLKEYIKEKLQEV